MSAQPKVSVIVPVYNVEKYLPKCLDSLVRQTLDDLEIIVIDDGSTDASGAIADRYAENAENMVVLHRPNGGYGKAMNLGLSVARGEFIGILESDDWCSPMMFERMYELATEKGVEVLKCDYYLWWGESNYSRYYNILPENMYNVITTIKDCTRFVLMPPSIWSAVYRHDFLVENEINFRETPGASYQDTSFSHKALFSAKSFLVVNEAYLYYRQDNLSSSVNDKRKIFYVCDEYDESRAFLSKRDESLIPILERARLAVDLWNYNRLDYEGRREFYPKLREDFVKVKNEGLLTRDLYDQKVLLKILSIINKLGKYSQKRQESGEIFKEPITF